MESKPQVSSIDSDESHAGGPLTGAFAKYLTLLAQLNIEVTDGMHEIFLDMYLAGAYEALTIQTEGQKHVNGEFTAYTNKELLLEAGSSALAEAINNMPPEQCAAVVQATHDEEDEDSLDFVSDPVMSAKNPPIDSDTMQLLSMRRPDKASYH